MPNIRYHEYRPGRWMKVVDGQAVGPATDEEVSAWKREVEAQSSIWEDVVKAARPPTPSKRAPEPEAIEVPWPPPARGQPRTATLEERGTPPAGTPSSGKGAAQMAAAAESADSASVTRLLRTVEEIRAAKESAKPTTRRSARARAAPVSPAPAEAEREASTALTAPGVQAAPPARDEGMRRVEAPLRAGPPQPDRPSDTQPSEPTPGVTETMGDQADAAEITAGVGLHAGVIETAEPPLPEGLAPAAITEEAIEPEPAPAAEGVTRGEESETEDGTLLKEEPGAEAMAPELEEAIALAEELAEVEGESPAGVAAEGVAESEVAAGPEAAPATPESQAEEESPEASEQEWSEPERGRASSVAQRRAAKTQARAPRTRERKGHVYVWFEAAPADDLAAAVRAGIAKYKERFGQPAGAVLCHSADLPALEQAGLGVDVRQGKNVPPRNFWIGSK